MPKIYYVNFKDHLRLAKVILAHIILTIIVGIVIMLQSEGQGLYFVKVLSGVMFLFILPAIFLHITYYLHHRGWIIKEYENHLEIEINGKEKIINIDLAHIDQINIYMSPTTINYNRTNGLPSECFNYIKITTPDIEVIITNLIYPNIKALASRFSAIKPVYHKTIYADF